MSQKINIDHIAKLARLNLKDKEKEQTEKELSSILNYIEKLKEVNVDQVLPVSHSNNIFNATREDKKIFIEQKTRENLLKSAPERKEKLIKVKSIFQ